jgi:hypothetical protein
MSYFVSVVFGIVNEHEVVIGRNANVEFETFATVGERVFEGRKGVLGMGTTTTSVSEQERTRPLAH